MTFFFTDRKLKIFTDGILFSRAEILIVFCFVFFHYFKAFFWSKYDFLQCPPPPPGFLKLLVFLTRTIFFICFSVLFSGAFSLNFKSFLSFLLLLFWRVFIISRVFWAAHWNIYFLIEKTSLEPSKSVILKLKYWTHHPSHYPFSKNYKSITSYMADHHWW